MNDAETAIKNRCQNDKSKDEESDTVSTKFEATPENNVKEAKENLETKDEEQDATNNVSEEKTNFEEEAEIVNIESTPSDDIPSTDDKLLGLCITYLL